MWLMLLLWILLFLVVYTYVGYPLVLWAFSRGNPSVVRKSKISPRVSIIITARNEADKIRRKIENTLTLAYARSSSEIIVASDASNDGTDEIVRGYAVHGVRLVRAPERMGKEHAQGLALATAVGEIIVFTDAATLLDADALNHLVWNFADPTIGAVSTEDVLVDSTGAPTTEALYVKYEMWVRRLESRFHSLVGLSGSCFAIRRELCARWSREFASDFMASLRAARRGFRSVADPLARGRFSAVISPQYELTRKIRTFLRGITVLMANVEMLNPLRYRRFAFQLASHKLLRFLAPFFLVGILVLSGTRAEERLVGALFWGQTLCYSLGTVGSLFTWWQRYRVIRVATYFTLAQWAMLVAWAKYARGHQQLTWEPSRRPGSVAGGHR